MIHFELIFIWSMRCRFFFFLTFICSVAPAPFVKWLSFLPWIAFHLFQKSQASHIWQNPNSKGKKISTPLSIHMCLLSERKWSHVSVAMYPGGMSNEVNLWSTSGLASGNLCHKYFKTFVFLYKEKCTSHGINDLS